MLDLEILIMNDDALLFTVLTLSEASAWWGKSKTAIQMKFWRLEQKTGRAMLRKSGNNYLLLSSDMFSIYGVPKNDRPNYE